jgi:hypothetical protein
MATNDTRPTRYTAVQKAAIAVGAVFGVLLSRRAVVATPETAVPHPTR